MILFVASCSEQFSERNDKEAFRVGLPLHSYWKSLLADCKEAPLFSFHLDSVQQKLPSFENDKRKPELLPAAREKVWVNARLYRTVHCSLKDVWFAIFGLFVVQLGQHPHLKHSKQTVLAKESKTKISPIKTDSTCLP